MAAAVELVDGSGSAAGSANVTEALPYEIRVSIELQPSPGAGTYGVFVHQFGDLRAGMFDDVGRIFRPVGCDASSAPACESDKAHGLPPSAQRHPGELGNIVCTASAGPCAAVLTVAEDKATLVSGNARSLIGRTLTVSSMEYSGDGDLATTDLIAGGVIARSTGGESLGASGSFEAEKLVCAIFDATVGSGFQMFLEEQRCTLPGAPG